MVSLAEVRRWRPASLEPVYGRLCDAETTLMHAGDDFIGAGNRLGSWEGTAAIAAEADHRVLTGQIDHHVAGIRLLISSIAEATDAIEAVQRAVSEAEDLAHRYGFTVSETGEITDALSTPGRGDPHPDDRANARAEVRAALDQAERTATDIDNDLADVLRRAGRGEVGTGAETTMAAAAAHGAGATGLTLPDPPADATPTQNAGWWASLSPNAQALLLANRPGLLGNRDGIPFAVRDKANRARLPQLRASLEQQRDNLLRALRNAHPAGTDNRTTVATDFALQHQLDNIEAKLDSLDAIGRTLGRTDHHLLTLNTDAERVEAAVATGNVDTAKHIAVFTPGFNSTVNGSLENYDAQLGDMHKLANQIQLKNGQSPSVATVTWLGYQAPQSSEIGDLPGNSVASPSAASHGAEKLSAFLEGIDSARPGNSPHLTAIGHSYGSTTTGFSLIGNHSANDAVLLGSPGFGAQSAESLHVKGGNIYTEWANGDYVPYLNAPRTLGQSPYVEPDSFQRISTGASSGDFGPLQPSHGHSEYLKSHSTSQYNLAAIISGHSEMLKKW